MFTSRRVSLLAPSNEVVPQPVARAFSFPGAQKAASSAPAIWIGVEFEEGEGELSSAKTTSQSIVFGSNSGLPELSLKKRSLLQAISCPWLELESVVRPVIDAWRLAGKNVPKMSL
jgi:hypothetical protein